MTTFFTFLLALVVVLIVLGCAIINYVIPLEDEMETALRSASREIDERERVGK